MLEREKKLSLFADDMMSQVEIMSDTHRTKLLELMYNFSKFTGYKINIQRSVKFLYAKEKETKNRLREQFHL